MAERLTWAFAPSPPSTRRRRGRRNPATPLCSRRGSGLSEGAGGSAGRGQDRGPRGRSDTWPVLVIFCPGGSCPHSADEGHGLSSQSKSLPAPGLSGGTEPAAQGDQLHARPEPRNRGPGLQHFPSRRVPHLCRGAQQLPPQHDTRRRCWLGKSVLRPSQAWGAAQRAALFRGAGGLGGSSTRSANRITETVLLWASP